MSPNEFQLRQALHDGEGDPVDPDRLIAHAIGVRQERRHKINTIVAGGAAVAVVGLCASAVIAFGGGDDSGPSGSAAVAGRADRAAPSAAAPAAGQSAAVTSAAASASAGAGANAPQGSASSTAAGSAAASPAQACPSTPERYLLPGGGGLGQFGSTEPLFSDKVASLRLCGYPLRASAGRTTAVLDGSAAQAIVTELNAASSRMPTAKPCPANINYVAGTVELIGVTSSGRATRPVVVTLGCVVSTATNGTAVRYVGDIPEVLARMVVPIPLKSTAGVPGKITVSPVR